MEEVATNGGESAALLGPIILGYGMNLVEAIVILVVGWWLAGFVSNIVKKQLGKRKKVDATLKPVIASIVRYTIIVLTVVAVLGRFGVETASIIAVLGAAGLAVGLALQGTLQNIAAGIMLLLLRPFKVGDFIDAGGIGGTVEEISLFTTELTTFDGIYVSAPNSRLWGASITNFSRNPTRRLDVTVGISYGDDIDKGMKVLMDIAKKDKRVLKDPEPVVWCTSLGDSSVNIQLRCWIETGDFWPAKFEITKKAKEEVEKAGLSIPFPQRDVHIHQAPGAN